MGDTLTYAWTGTAGSFDAPTSNETGWTAPMTPGPVTLTLTVTDSKGATAALSLTLTVEGGGTDGGVGGSSATVGATFNAWPQVTRMTASPSFLAVGETATLDALVTDLDGDALSYQWTVLDGCPGTLANATSPAVSQAMSGAASARRPGEGGHEARRLRRRKARTLALTQPAPVSCETFMWRFDASSPCVSCVDPCSCLHPLSSGTCPPA
jgi:hypothetical protein